MNIKHFISTVKSIKLPSRPLVPAESMVRLTTKVPRKLVLSFVAISTEETGEFYFDDCQIDGAFDILVDPKALLKSIDFLKGEPIFSFTQDPDTTKEGKDGEEITVKSDSGVLKMTVGSKSLSIKGINVDEGSLPAFSVKTFFSPDCPVSWIDADDLFMQNLILSKRFCSEDETHKLLWNPMLVDGQIYGTDGRRLFVNQLLPKHDGFTFSAKIPSCRTSGTLKIGHYDPYNLPRTEKGVLTEDGERLMEAYGGIEVMLIQGEDFKWVGRIAEGTLPNVKSVIPTSNDYRLLFNLNNPDIPPFLKLIGGKDATMLDLFVTSKSPNKMGMRIRNSEESYESQTQNIGLDCDEDYKVTFNRDFVVDCLAAGLSIVSWNGAPGPVVFYGSSDKVFCVLMPMSA